MVAIQNNLIIKIKPSPIEMLYSTQEIDTSFILISKNYLNDVSFRINPEFIEQVPPRIIKEFPFSYQFNCATEEAEHYFYQNKKHLNRHKTIGEKIFAILQTGKYRAGTTRQTKFDENKQNFLLKIDTAIAKQEPITFVLPSFPFKCPNPAKVRRRSPDMAEILCLSRLYEICKVISKFYSPGAKFIIIADGDVYKEMFGITKYEALNYKETCISFIKQLGFSNQIEVVDMANLIEKNKSDYNIFLKNLKPQFSQWWNNNKESDKVRSLVDSSTANISSNTHICQDLVKLGTSRPYNKLDTEKLIRHIEDTRKKIFRRAEQCAFDYALFLYVLKEMDLINLSYPNAIRSTVHPKPKQWGIHLVNAKSRIFPWHGMAFLGDNGWKISYESELINERQTPVHLNGDDWPFFYESGTNSFYK
ncbi:MAG: L-tyrosine/L-tryptophan isonitrile synthase family protein [Gammaproteobacteria bacterium]|nr:L-tyrosine/L-tryptophan isonitrile synthase family protein [Gammaproteobacteria bacterium]